MQIKATDDDEPQNPNSEIAYTVIGQDPAEPKDMFYIDKKGRLLVKQPTLDREVHSIPWQI